MQRKEETSANWRELALYGGLATLLTTLNASLFTLLGF